MARARPAVLVERARSSNSLTDLFDTRQTRIRDARFLLRLRPRSDEGG